MTGSDDGWFSSPQFATQLEARVVDHSGADARIHGYQVIGDLARHFSYSEVLLLALTGREPDETRSELFRIAMIALSPIGVGSAPCHLGILAHIVSRSYVSSLAAAAIALAERAASCLAERRGLLERLRAKAAPEAEELGPVQRSVLDDDVLVLLSMHSQLARRPWFVNLDRLTALIVVLYECGLEDDWKLESALFHAWSPCMMAEMGPRGNDPLESYPVNVPRFKYVAP